MVVRDCYYYNYLLEMFSSIEFESIGADVGLV